MTLQEKCLVEAIDEADGGDLVDGMAVSGAWRLSSLRFGWR